MSTVLIIEDDESLIEGLTLILQDEGYNVATLLPVKKVSLESVSRVNPAVILLDYLLPKENGLVLASRLKAEESTKNIPIVMMSATKSIMEKAIKESGVKYFLPKPFDIDQLLSLVRKCCIHYNNGY